MPPVHESLSYEDKRMMQPEHATTVLVDAIQSVGIHNGIVRLVCVRLDAKGTPTPALELCIPMNQVHVFADALQKASR